MSLNPVNISTVITEEVVVDKIEGLKELDIEDDEDETNEDEIINDSEDAEDTEDED